MRITNNYNHWNILDLALDLNYISFSTLTWHTLGQWLSTFFVFVHPLEVARKPVHPCHAQKSTTAKVQNLSDFYVVDIA